MEVRYFRDRFNRIEFKSFGASEVKDTVFRPHDMLGINGTDTNGSRKMALSILSETLCRM